MGSGIGATIEMLCGPIRLLRSGEGDKSTGRPDECGWRGCHLANSNPIFRVCMVPHRNRPSFADLLVPSLDASKVWEEPTGTRITVLLCALVSQSAAEVKTRCELAPLFGGGGGIRTHEDREVPAVFKTAALNHSATPPFYSIAPRAPAVNHVRGEQWEDSGRHAATLP
jgi:hypothetical protein